MSEDTYTPSLGEDVVEAGVMERVIPNKEIPDINFGTQSDVTSAQVWNFFKRSGHEAAQEFEKAFSGTKIKTEAPELFQGKWHFRSKTRDLVVQCTKPGYIQVGGVTERMPSKYARFQNHGFATDVPELAEGIRMSPSYERGEVRDVTDQMRHYDKQLKAAAEKARLDKINAEKEAKAEHRRQLHEEAKKMLPGYLSDLGLDQEAIDYITRMKERGAMLTQKDQSSNEAVGTKGEVQEG